MDFKISVPDCQAVNSALYYAMFFLFHNKWWSLYIHNTPCKNLTTKSNMDEFFSVGLT